MADSVCYGCCGWGYVCSLDVGRGEGGPGFLEMDLEVLLLISWAMVGI
jgi:hypothetical protein